MAAQDDRVTLEIFRWNRALKYVPRDHALSAKARPTEVRPIRVRGQIKVFFNDTVELAGRCIVDTGSPVTVFPHRIWSHFPEGMIRWWKAAEGDIPSENFAKTGGLAGDSQPSELGLIEIAIGGVNLAKPEWTERTLIVGKFAHAEAELNLDEVLLGINALEFQGIAKQRQKSRLVIDFQSEPELAYLAISNSSGSIQ
jgi:hypothetical protein